VTLVWDLPEEGYGNPFELRWPLVYTRLAYFGDACGHVPDTEKEPSIDLRTQTETYDWESVSRYQASLEFIGSELSEVTVRGEVALRQ